MNFLQEKSIPLPNQFEYEDTGAAKADSDFLIRTDTLYYIVPLLTVAIVYFSIKKFKPFDSSYCPCCQGKLLRTNRRKADYILNFLVLNLIKIRRYKCKNCKWEGLRIKYR